MTDRLCWSCQHIRWEGGSPGYSEYTPGDNMRVYCERKHWRLDIFGDELPDFRRYLEMARTCPDFVLSAEAAQIEAARQS